MDFTPQTKEDLRLAKITIDSNIERVNANSIEIKNKGKVNTPFLIISFVVAFLYPIFFTPFDILSYSLFWALSVLMLAIRLEIFLRLIKSELEYAGYKLVQTAIENDLEFIRKKEYDELTRKVYDKEAGEKLQSTDVSTTGS